MSARRTATGQEIRLVQPLPDVAGRLPPHDLDAEAATLSAVILDRDALVLVLDALKPEHFYSEANSRIFQAIQALASSETPIDLVALVGWLRDREWLGKVGGSAAVAELADASPDVRNVLTHARQVFNKWRLRQAIATCQRVAAEGYGDVGELQEFLDGAVTSLEDIARASSTDELDRFSLGSIARESIAETIALADAPPGAFISTGVRTLDEKTGLYRNELTLLGAPKGIGKTTLARFIVDRLARSPYALPAGFASCPRCSAQGPCSDAHAVLKRGTVVFQLEGTRRDWTDYAAAKEARLNLFDRRNGRWSAEQNEAFLGMCERMHGAPIVVDDRKDLCRANLARRVRSWRRWFEKRGAVLELVVLDYFQIAAWERGKGTREEDLNDAGRHIIRLATDTSGDLSGLAWLVISALNKDGVTRESAALEYHCDAFWKLSESKAPVYGAEKALNLWIEKQRRGPSKCSVAFTFDPEMGTFW